MKVAILNFEGVVGSSVTGPYDILSKTCQIASILEIDVPVTFDVDIVNAPNYQTTHLGSIKGNILLENTPPYDLVIIPAMGFDCVEQVLQRETELMEWIKKQHAQGAELASVCLGTFILAATGLLDGRRATTHWMGAQLFRMLFPQVELQDDKVIVDEGRIYSCGGAFSFTTLMIYLIEKFCGREISVVATKTFMIHVHDSPQSAFSIFQLQKSHNDPEISKIQSFIEVNYAQRLALESLAETSNMSLRTFIRRFTQATGNSPLQYIQRVRVEAAKRLLEKSSDTIEQVSLKIGYEDFNFFRRIFKRYTGISPQLYRKKYGTSVAELAIM